MTSDSNRHSFRHRLDKDQITDEEKTDAQDEQKRREEESREVRM